jgi:hypothetical protein
MTMERYFDSLQQMSGAKEIVLLRDRASSSTSLLGEEKKKDVMFRRAASFPSYGPPRCPHRKTSLDNLRVLRAKRSSRKTSSNKPDALKDFFDEVAPGMRPRPKSRERSKTKNNKNWVSQQDKEGGGPSPAKGSALLLKSKSKSLLSNVFSDVVQSRDDNRARRGPSHERHTPKKVHHLKEFLEEALVEVVVGGRIISLNMDMSRKETRWT